jgi:hypothetical protein
MSFDVIICGYPLAALLSLKDTRSLYLFLHLDWHSAHTPIAFSRATILTATCNYD